MKNRMILVIGGLLSLALVSGVVQAQTVNNDPSTTTPAVEPPTTAPPNFARPNVPDDVKALIKSLQDARNQFLAQKKAELAKLKGATQEQRAAIREALQASRDAFLENQQNMREQLRTRLEELRKEFAANHQKLVDEIKAKVEDRARKGN